MNQNLTPVHWAKRPIEKYADFAGRAPRAEYWWYALALIVVYIVVMIVESIVGINKMVFGVYGPLTLLLALGTLVPNLAVGVRRLHDTNRSAWWLLLLVPYLISAFLMVQAMAAGSMAGFGAAGLMGLVGLVCCIIFLVLMVLSGTPGDNRYGPNPYGVGPSAVPAE
ncbi:MAG: DUF805 domain-containing protein [Sphingomicrobium sp.]